MLAKLAKAKVLDSHVTLQSLSALLPVVSSKLDSNENTAAQSGKEKS